MYLYASREHGGKKLVPLVKGFLSNKKKRGYEASSLMVLAISHGGVPVASALVDELGLSYDVIVAREIHYPGSLDLEVGALAENERAYLADEVNFADPRILDVIQEERLELRRQKALFRRGHELPPLSEKNVLLVDDGLLKGIRVLAAAKYVKEKGAQEVHLATPLILESDHTLLLKFLDQILCPYRPIDAISIDRCYRDYHEVSDEEVLDLLGRRQNLLSTGHLSYES